MTRNDKLRMVDAIQDYADTVLKGVDKEQVPVSMQIEMLRPKMQEMAQTYGIELTEVFVIYMDEISKAQAQKEAQSQQEMEED